MKKKVKEHESDSASRSLRSADTYSSSLWSTQLFIRLVEAQKIQPSW